MGSKAGLNALVGRKLPVPVGKPRWYSPVPDVALRIGTTSRSFTLMVKRDLLGGLWVVTGQY